MQRNDLAGALWAVLTHPRCTAELERAVVGEIHMIQHQIGACTRLDHARLEEAVAEAARLKSANQDLQQRLVRQASGHASRTDALAPA